MESLKGNAIIAQSGGPTAVINSTLCGIIQEAAKHREIEIVYAAHNGILGVLNEELIDISKEDDKQIEALKWTPSAGFGSCRYKLKDIAKNKADYMRIIDIFKAHNIRYFFYNGGNDSMDTASKIKKCAEDINYDIKIIGCAKTVDNDLAYTDHCPGFGSVAKYIAASTMEAGRDNEALYTTDTITIIETMGRNAGWIAGAAALAKRFNGDAPHLIYLPEVALNVDTFCADVKKILDKHQRAVIVVSEGIKDEKGKYISESAGDFAKDSFGHVQLGGAGETIKGIIENKVKVKARVNKAGTFQRSSVFYTSKTDRDEAYQTGAYAVQSALKGESGYMVAMEREEGKNYKVKNILVPLEKVANGEKMVPRDWINREGNNVTQEFIDYVRPLILGEIEVDNDNGLPLFTNLEKNYVNKILPEYTV